MSPVDPPAAVLRGPALIEALRKPQCYPHAVDRIELIETHLSWALLAGEYAYKIKKPVDLGFADFSTLERRRHFCEEELRLNRRYAPAVYLEVVGIRDTPSGPALHGDGPVLEYAVKMCRFPQEALASRMLTAGRLSRDHVRSLAESVAAFHAAAAVAGAATLHGEPDAVLGVALENIVQMIDLRLPQEYQPKLHELRLWTERHFAGLRETVRARKSGGFVRECHGDLHLNNVALLEGALTPFDGIEFNDSLRWIDVASDVAFTVMDLAARGRSDLAWDFLDAWLERTGDYGALEVMRFYLVYRALVRAKVALLRQPPDCQEFARYLGTAQNYVKPGAPAVLIMHGLSGSGKTTVAGALARALGAVRIRSDVVRKQLAAYPSLARTHSAVGQGLYGEKSTHATYFALVTLAGRIAPAGFPVIVDAAFLRHCQRELMRRAAREAGASFIIISLRAPEKTLRERVRARLETGTDASEADESVLEHQLARQNPLSGDELLGTLTLDGAAAQTGRRWDACLRDLAARTGIRLTEGPAPPAHS
jgi:aminoglycoside phosphotransferase family enzyme/predicted kinase